MKQANEKLEADDKVAAPAASESLKAAQEGLEEARKVETTARGAVQTAMADLALRTQQEAALFGRSRDRSPYWTAVPSTRPLEADPLRRVMLFAFPDQRTLFVRGAAEDVKQVRALVAQFDRPAPQARITLWSLEMNSQTDRKGNKKASEALALIDQHLGSARRRIELVPLLLREAIAAQVKHDDETPGEPTQRGHLGVYDFYEVSLLKGLGLVRDEGLGRHEHQSIARFLLPDPRNTMTLADCVLVLSLLEEKKRAVILDDFKARLAQRLTPTEDPSATKYAARAVKDKDAARQDALAVSEAIRRELAVGSGDFAQAHPSLRQGLIELLRIQGARRMISFIRPRLEIIHEIMQRDHPERFQDDLSNQWNEIDPLFQYLDEVLYYVLPVPDNKSETKSEASGARTKGTIKKAEIRTAQLLAVEKSTTLGITYAQEAKLNEGLKRITQAISDEAAVVLVEPELRQMEKSIRGVGIAAGIMQRTSVLASNRLVARVSVRATANLPVGENVDAIGTAMQLLQLANTSTPQGLAGAVSGLQKQTKELPPAVYGISSGSPFVITPIIDPSGQAMRFRLDYVAQNQIREPNGAVDPQLSRVEYHEVNTEIQLSNLELREVTRFEGNAKLGLTARTTGGLPVLKYLPVIREIPLLGWFTKRQGSAASVQRSVVFAQTAIFPTIESVIDSLVSSPITRDPIDLQQKD